MTPDWVGQVDPPKPDSRQGSGPQSGPHCSEAQTDLARLTFIWPDLSEATRGAIVTLAEASKASTVAGLPIPDAPSALALPAPAQSGMAKRAWELLPEDTRASLIESINDAMKNMSADEKREAERFRESLECKPQRVDE